MCLSPNSVSYMLKLFVGLALYNSVDVPSCFAIFCTYWCDHVIVFTQSGCLMNFTLPFVLLLMSVVVAYCCYEFVYASNWCAVAFLFIEYRSGVDFVLQSFELCFSAQ